MILRFRPFGVNWTWQSLAVEAGPPGIETKIMWNALSRLLFCRNIALPLIGLLAIGATACEGLGVPQARQAVENEREIRDLEDRELRPLEEDLDALYESEILPRERELEDLWDQVREREDGEIWDAYEMFEDPWAPGGEAHALQQEFDARFAEITRRFRELDAESNRIHIEQQWSDSYQGIDPAVAALEDERFQLQRQLDRLHHFGRRPIEDIYQQMNELNAMNGWAEGDIYAAEEINRQIANIQNQLSHLYNSEAHVSGQLQTDLESIDDELDHLRSFGFEPVNDLYSRIAELEHELANAGEALSGTAADSDTLAELQQLEDELSQLISPLQGEIDALSDSIQVIISEAQVQVDDLNSQQPASADTAGTDALQAEIDGLLQQITDLQATTTNTIAVLNASIADLETQITDSIAAADSAVAGYQAQVHDLQAQISDLDPEADDYEDTKSALEAQIGELESDIASAISENDAAVADLQSQIDLLVDQKTAEQQVSDTAIADLQSQVDSKQAELDAALAADASTSDPDIAAQIAAIEQDRDDRVADLQAQIDGLTAQINEFKASYEPRLSELRMAAGSAPATGSDDTAALELEIQSLRDEATRMEQDLNSKIHSLEQQRNSILQSMANGNSNSGETVHLEAELQRLHDEIRALQNRDLDASRQYNQKMEELQKEALRLEKQMNIDIRALEDQVWELDTQINEHYHSGSAELFDPHAEFNEKLKQIEMERFELEQQRWELEDEQHVAFERFNNLDHELRAEAEALSKEKLQPLYDRIRALESELKEIRFKQRDLEDQLREAEKRVDERRRELENQTLDAIEDALEDAEQAGGGLDSLAPASTEQAGTE